MKKRMMAAIIGLCMITLMGCGSKEGELETNTKVMESEVKETTQNNTKENDMSEVTFDYTILDDGTLSIWSYNAENVPEVFEIPEEIDGPSTGEDVTPYSNFGLCADTLRVHVPAGSTAESVVTEAVEGLDSSTVIEVIAE